MSIEPIQAPLFLEPIGERFRRARESKQWSKQTVAQQLRLPLVVIEAIENEDWARLGAPIYVRSYVGSYARILGLPSEITNDIAQDKPLPKLQPLGGRSRARNFFDRSAFNLASLVMTGIIVSLVVMLAMHFNSSAPLVQILPLDPGIPVDEGVGMASSKAFTSSTDHPPLPTATISNSFASAAPSSVDLMPVMGSLAPSMPSANAHQATGELVLHFQDQSWVEITDVDGHRLEHGLIPAGTERRYGVDQAPRIILGNAKAVEISLDGQLLDITPYQEANIARFTVSSEGQILPPGG